MIKLSTKPGQGHLDLYLDQDIRACARQMATYDEFLQTAYRVWTGDDPDGFQVDLHIGSEHCDADISGCAAGHTAWVRSPSAQYHELSHLITYAADGRTVSLLEEGSAEALGSGFPNVLSSTSLRSIPIDEFFSAAPDLALKYAAAGHYVRYLMDEHGHERMRSYYRSMRPYAHDPRLGITDFKREFSIAFDIDFDASWADFVGQPRCTYDLWYCTAAEPIAIPFSAGAADCDAAGVLNFTEEDPTPETRFRPLRLFRLEDTAKLDLVMTLANVRATILWCGECSERSESEDWLSADPTPWRRQLELDRGVRIFAVEALDPTLPSSFELRAAE